MESCYSDGSHKEGNGQDSSYRIEGGYACDDDAEEQGVVETSLAFRHLPRLLSFKEQLLHGAIADEQKGGV